MSFRFPYSELPVTTQLFVWSKITNAENPGSSLMPIFFQRVRLLSVVSMLTSFLPAIANAQQSIRTPESPAFSALSANPQASFITVGPFRGAANAGVGYSYTDNANTTEFNKLADNQFYESLGLGLSWPISAFNQIDIALNGRLEEDFYSNGTNALNVEILPGSQIRFQVEIGSVQVRAFEQFAIIQDPVADPTASGQTNLNRLINTFGVSAAVPVGVMKLGFEVDYTYSSALNGTPTGAGTQSVGDVRNSFRLASTIGFAASPSLDYGLEISATANTGAGPNDVNSLSIGPFIRGRLTQLIEVDAGTGLTIVDAPGLGPAQYYGYVSIRHHLSRVTEILLGVSHDLIFSDGLNLAKSNDFYLTLQTQLTPQVTCSVGPFVDFGRVISGENPGSYTQYGVSAGSTFQLSRQITTAISYRFARRDGADPSGRYIQNLFSLQFGYGF